MAAPIDALMLAASKARPKKKPSSTGEKQAASVAPVEQRALTATHADPFPGAMTRALGEHVRAVLPRRKS